jgi:hypothetical protein
MTDHAFPKKFLYYKKFLVSLSSQHHRDHFEKTIVRQYGDHFCLFIVAAHTHARCLH